MFHVEPPANSNKELVASLGAEIPTALSTGWLGRIVYFYPSVESTNVIARQLIELGEGEGAVILAEEQTGGRGRGRRSWYSAKGLGIYLSMILRPPADLPHLQVLTLAAAVAVAEAIEAITGLETGIKWPNDLMIAGKKVAGILAEAVTGPRGEAKLVLGIGINVYHQPDNFPSTLREKASSLEIAGARLPGRGLLLARVLQEVERWYETWVEAGAEPIIAAWKKKAATLGREVRVAVGGQVLQGKALDVAADGALLLQTEDGRVVPVASGDIEELTTAAATGPPTTTAN